MMRFIFHPFSFLVLIGLALWASQMKNETREMKRTYKDVQSKIVKTRENIRVYQSEWAFLNRPERLRELASLYYTELRLNAVKAAHFMDIEKIPFAVEQNLSPHAHGFDRPFERGLKTYRGLETYNE